MHPKTLLSLALAVGIAGSSVAAQGKLPSQVSDFYSKNVSLIQKKDITGLEKLYNANFASDYVSYSAPDKTGKVKKKNRSQDVESTKKAFSYISNFSKAKATITKFTVSKNSITVFVTADLVGLIKGAPDKKVHTLAILESNGDTWVKVGNAWKLKVGKSLSNKTTVDGAPIAG